VFSASQTGLPIASSNSKSASAIAPKSTTQDSEFKPQPVHQPQTTTENVLSSIPGVNPTRGANPTSGANPTQVPVQNQAQHKSRTRRPRFVNSKVTFHILSFIVVVLEDYMSTLLKLLDN